LRKPATLLRTLINAVRRPPIHLAELAPTPWAITHGQYASVEDIFYCFRLLLGRSPNIEEWSGHSARAGEPLADVVRTYVNSGEFSRRNLSAANMPAGITHGNNGRFHVFADANDPIIGSPALRGQYEPQVTRALEDLLTLGDTFLDVGANIGYFSLLAATLVGPQGHVYAVEPNDANVKLLESSIRRNGFKNITVMQVGATNRLQTLFLHATTGNGSTSAPGESDDLFAARTVPGIPLDNLLTQRQSPLKLIKIDVEGYEYKALQGARTVLAQDRPHIVFEFSANGLADISGPDFLGWLASLGYAFTNISAGRPLGATQTVAAIMADFEAARVDHIDVLATPIAP
jgi:FkbM family methyltransferase